MGEAVRFAPALARAVQAELQDGKTVGDIDNLLVGGAASLRGISLLTGLQTLILERPRCLAHLRGHPTLARLHAFNRGYKTRELDIEPLADLPALQHVMLASWRLRDLGPLATCRLETLDLNYCEVAAQRLRPPESLVELDLDGTAGLTLVGVCPNLRLVDLWGTGMEPVPWIAEQPAIEELWLVGCSVPTLEPLLAMPRPPRWIFMDGHSDEDLIRHRAAITALEARGARFALGSPHEMGIWIPSWDRVSEREEEPLYLSPGWPRSKPEE